MRVSRELMASQELLRLVVEHGPNGVAVFDRQMRKISSTLSDDAIGEIWVEVCQSFDDSQVVLEVP